jgi:uncharacterized protein (TIGR01244 family)
MPMSIPNLLQVESGVWSAGQPGPDEWARLPEAGIGAVVNLRGADEQPGFDEAAAVRKLGLDYHAFPVGSPADFGPERVAAFAELVARLRPKGVLVHCGSGNRVGAMFALARAREPGISVDAALEYGRRAGLVGLEPQVATLLRNAR